MYFLKNYNFSELYFQHFFLLYDKYSKIKLLTPNTKKYFKENIHIKKKIKLWIAILMKKKKICKIIKPYWLKYEWLDWKYTNEKMFLELQWIPNFYMELIHLFISSSKTFITNSLKLYHKIKKLYFLRFKKIWIGILTLSETNVIVNLGKIESTELYYVKNLLKIILSILTWLND